MNEARALEYVRTHTTIPVPTTLAAFEDRGSFYLIQEFIPGVLGSHAPTYAHKKIVKQLEGFVKQLQSCRSDTVRSFVDGHRFLTPRLGIDADLLEPAEYATDKDGYHLCHGDLGWHNFMVDPMTWKIVGVFDWEYAGFYLAGMEGEHWKRQGPSSPSVPGDVIDNGSLVRKLWEARAPVTGGARRTTPSSTVDETSESGSEPL